MLGTVSKAGDVMSLFTPLTPEWGVSEVSERMHLPKSSAHALLSTLTEIGLVRRIQGGRYRLGWKLIELHRTLVVTTDFLEPAGAVLAQLAANLSATVHMAALRQHEVVYLDKVADPRAPVLTASACGLTAAAHSTAIGKVLLADRDDLFCEGLATKHGLRRFTPSTITSLAALQDELDQVRLKGFATDISETLPGVCCIAFPIRDATGAVQAAVSTTVPAKQFEQLEVQLRRSIKNAAAAIVKRTCAQPTSPSFPHDVSHGNGIA